AAASRLSDYNRKNRYLQIGHLKQIPGNRLSLSSLLGIHAAVSSRRVYKADNGTAERLRLLHQAQRLAVSVRGRHSKVSFNIVFGISSLLLSDHRHRHAVEHGNSSHDGP